MPIRLRLTAAFALAMAVVLAGVGALLYARMASALDRAVDRNLRDRASDVAALVRHGGIALPEGAGGLSEGGETFAQVLDRSGTVVDSTADLDEPLLDPTDIARVQADPSSVERPLPGSDDPARLLVMPVDLDGRRLLVVVGESLEPRDEALESLLTELLIGGPVLLLLASGGAYVLAGRALRPLNEVLGRLEAALARERRFVSDASHELRTPLAALRTELELALRRERSPQELEAALRSAAEEADRLSQLAEDLLVLARSQDGELPMRRERLETGGLLRSVRERYERRAAAEGRPLVVQEGSTFTVEADRLRIEQALGNLVENALRHGRGAIELAAERNNGRVELHVRDAGPGFEGDFLPRAFEPFARGDPARSGTGAGLGLAIVELVARAHGGSARAANGASGADVWLELDEAAA